MAHTKINTQVIPDGTIVSADLTMPITGFSSTGIDDNATSNALTINSSGDVAISGNLTAGNNTDISMGATAPGQLKIDGVGYGGAIALDSTGMYIYHNSGSRSLLFGTNETERMRITSAGNVAVATTQDFQSGQKLAVGDGSSNSGITVYSGSASQGRLYFASATTGAGQRAGQIYYDHSNNSMTVSTNGDNPRISVLQNGNVGIGTSSPQEKLHVYTTGNARAEIESTVGIAAFKATNNQGSYAWYVDANADKFHLFDFTDSVDRMTIDGSGNVGIGGGTSSNGMLTIESTSTNHINLQAGNTAVNGRLLVSHSSTGAFIRTASGSSGTCDNLKLGTSLSERMRIDSSGNVGIGSDNPDGQLHIKGSTNKTLKLDPTFSSGSYTSLAFARNGNDLWRVFQTSSDSYLSFYNEQSSQHQLTLENSGNIGINETNPYSPLHIEKITETASYTATSFNSQPTIMLRHTSATGGYNGTRYTNSAGNYEWFTGAVQTSANTADFVFQGYNRTAGAYQEHLRISEEGHLFIGRTSYTNAATDHGTQLYNNGVIYQFSASTGNSDVYRWHNGSGTKIGYLQGDGDLFLSGTVKAQGGLQSGLGRAYSNVGVTGYNRMPVGHYTPGETVFEIDPTWSSSQLQDYFNLTSGACDWVEDSTAPGGYAIKITGNRSVAGNYSAGFPYIPVDQDDIFYMECWIKTTGGGTVRHYMGSIDYSHTFASLGGNPGSFGYWVMSNTAITTAMGWTKVSGYITGFGNSVGQFESGTKYWTPQALFNYTLNSGTRESYISGWKVIRVRSPGNRTFANDVTVNGTLSKTSGSFKIDHPLPSMTDTHHLVHSFIEGPRADLIYSDTIQLTNGAAIVNIDEYATMTEGTFEALCASVRCFTSNEDTWDAVKGSVTGNILTIECQNVSSNAFVSWMVIGERKDPSMMSTDWTNDNGRVIVEPEKVSEVLNAEYLEAPDPETANTD